MVMSIKYIAHYKCVETPEEFYSETRKSLDYPTQVRYKSKNYLLFATMIITTTKQEKKLVDVAKERNIECYVELQ